jgi:hypothetical protein
MGGYPFSLEPLDYFIVLRHFSKGITIIMHTIALLLASASEPNRAKPPPMKGVSFRRANHAELTFPPWGKFCGLGGGASFGPKRVFQFGSLGVTIHFPLRCSRYFGNSSGRGARIKNLRNLSYGSLSAQNRLGVSRKPGNEVPGSTRSQIGRLSSI